MATHLGENGDQDDDHAHGDGEDGDDGDQDGDHAHDDGDDGDDVDEDGAHDCLTFLV